MQCRDDVVWALGHLRHGLDSKLPNESKSIKAINNYFSHFRRLCNPLLPLADWLTRWLVSSGGLASRTILNCELARALARSPRDLSKHPLHAIIDNGDFGVCRVCQGGFTIVRVLELIWNCLRFFVVIVSCI